MSAPSREASSTATTNLEAEEGHASRVDSEGSSSPGDLHEGVDAATELVSLCHSDIRTPCLPWHPNTTPPPHHPITPPRHRPTIPPTHQGNNRRRSRVVPEELATPDENEDTFGPTDVDMDVEGGDHLGDDAPLFIRKKRYTLTRNGSVRQDSTRAALI